MQDFEQIDAGLLDAMGCLDGLAAGRLVCVRSAVMGALAVECFIAVPAELSEYPLFAPAGSDRDLFDIVLILRGVVHGDDFGVPSVDGVARLNHLSALVYSLIVKNDGVPF